MMKKRLAVLVAVTALGLTPALATEWMDCSDPTGHAQLGVLLGGLDFSEQSRAHMRLGDQWWSTDQAAEPGTTPFRVADYFFDWKEFSITVTDEDYNKVLGQMQLLIKTTDDGDAKGGVLSIPGHGVWAVTCDGP